MKKALLLTVMCIFALFNNVKAQETIQVGDQVTMSWANPIVDYYKYSVCQQIYTAEEMQGKTGFISRLSFQHATGGMATRDIVVYMKNIDKKSFATGSDWVEVTDADIVYSGTWSLPATLTTVINVAIDLTKTFEYTGGDLLLCMYDKTGTAMTANPNQFYCTKNAEQVNRTLFCINESSPIDMTALASLSGSRYKYTNNIEFTFAAEGNEGGDDNEGGNEGEGGEEPEPTPDPEQPGEGGDDNEGEEPETPSNTTIVEIGNDQNLSESNYSLPVTDYMKYSVSQQVYTEEDFDSHLGAIRSVAFKLSNNVSQVTRQYEVYIKHIDRDNMIGGYEAVTAADKVYDGDIVISGVKDSWLTIPFSTPFNYTGGNVMVCVYDKTGTKADPNYHTFYTYATEDPKRAMFSTSNTTPFEMNSLSSYMVAFKEYVNQVRFEMETKSIVKIAPETIDLGETMLGGYWSEAKPYEVSVKAVSTTVTDIKVDNNFFVLPSNVDYTADPIVMEVSYDKNATVDGEVNGNLIVSYGAETVSAPMTAKAYTPATGEVYELAQAITFEDGKYTHTPEFANLHDNYLLPGEAVNGNAPDAVYALELTEKTLLKAKVEGANAKLAIYREGFEGKGGPSNDNNFKGNVEIASEFFYDFNEAVLNGWTVRNNYNNGNNWQIVNGAGVDGTNCIVSYSYTTYPTSYFAADNYIITEHTYNITANSKLSFDAKCDVLQDGSIDRVKIEVSKDGESMTFIEEVTPTSATFTNKVVDLGAKFAALGLEYGDYHIVLHHQETSQFYVCVDNVRLSNPSSAKTRGNDVEEIYAVEYPAGKYYIVAAAENNFSFEIATINPEDLPAIPANLVATTIDEFSIELTWEAAERATSYNIYRNDAFLKNVTELSYIDENLTQNSDYCYVVKGYNDIMESIGSEKACAKTMKLTLEPPTSITAEATSTSTIVLTWSKVEKAAGYNIYWGEEVIDRVSDTTYVVEGLTASTEYCYTVSSVNKTIESFDKSDFACATTLDIVPVVPTNLTVTATSASSVKLSWDAAENAKRYYIYSADTLVAKTTYTYYNIVGLEEDTEYCYTVTSVNGDVESEASEEACGKTLVGDAIAELTSSLNIYPNPVNDKLYIETEMNVEEVVVYTITGVIAGQQSTVNSQQSLTIDVANLNSGVYFIKVRTENGEVVKRFVKK